MGHIPEEPDNDGYYQQVDDDRYADIPQNPLTKSGRRNFCQQRNAIHDEARKRYNLDVANGTYVNLPSSQIFCQCKNCGGGFIAKKADRKRGWGKYCSKSCKAQQH